MSKFRKKNSRNLPVKKQVKQNKKEIKMLKRRPEKKYNFVFRALAPAVTGATIIPLSLIPQGNTDISRIGNQISLVGLSYNFFAHYVAGGIVRLIIFVDRMNGLAAAPPPVGELLINVATPIEMCVSNYNTDFVGDKKSKFKILHDTGPIELFNGSQSYVAKKINKNLGMMKCQFDSPAFLLTNVVSSVVYYCFISNNTTSSWAYDSRLSFVDS